MNHIYRRIWSTAKQCWVVGSELARTTGKGTSGRRATVLMGCLISLPFAAGSAELDSDGEQLDLVETTQTLAFAEPAQ